MDAENLLVRHQSNKEINRNIKLEKQESPSDKSVFVGYSVSVESDQSDYVCSMQQKCKVRKSKSKSRNNHAKRPKIKRNVNGFMADDDPNLNNSLDSRNNHDYEDSDDDFDRETEKNERTVSNHEYFGCTICNRFFSSKKHLERHLTTAAHRKVLNPEEGKSHCKDCNVSFNNDNKSVEKHYKSRSHLRLAGISFYCRYCDAFYDTKEGFISHAKEFHPTRKICYICTDLLNSEIHLQDHMKVMHEEGKMWNCNECDASFRIERRLQRHMRERHMKEFYCDLCYVGFETEQRLNMHNNHIHQEKEIVIGINLKEFGFDEGKETMQGFIETQLGYIKELIEERQFEMERNSKVEYEPHADLVQGENGTQYSDDFEWKVESEVKDIFDNVSKCEIKVENEDIKEGVKYIDNQDLKIEEEIKFEVFDDNDNEDKEEIPIANSHSYLEHEGEPIDNTDSFSKNEQDEENMHTQSFNTNDSDFKAEENIAIGERNTITIRQKNDHRYNTMAFKCKLCKKGFKNQYILESHKKTKNHLRKLHGEDVVFDTEFKCDICSPEKVLTFLNLDAYNIHINSFGHKRKAGISFHCRLCKKVLDTRIEFLDHMKVEHPKAKQCDMCDFFTEGKTTVLNSHKKRMHLNLKDFMCFMDCGKGYSFQSELKKHLQESHDLSFVCFKCKMGFHVVSSYNEHLKSSHTENLMKCDVCERYFIEEQQYSLHMNMSHGVKAQSESFQCNECGKVLKSKHGLKEHIKQVHEKIKKFICTTCGEGFYSKQQCDYHVNSKHTNVGNRPFRCSICDKTFVVNSELQSHHTRAHVEKKWACKVCQLECDKKTELHQHFKINHQNAATVKCNECPKVFLTQNLLKIHILRVHTDMQRYTCQLCGIKFRSPSIAKKHLKDEHNTDERKYMKMIMIYRCRVCEAAFENVPDLRGHLSDIHNVTNQYWYIKPSLDQWT